ncbi:hypothetical protein [uncultured Chitinophaga sp.]|uniref:hypothetical protein n=1 Tax=uncultured Chitinophaga sp. TaxID=339340 RepID=UPI0025F0998B|nr:hypothetical protein [uncultured Chitinophaga sp.]
MNITPENYFEVAAGLNFSEMPKNIQEGHEYVKELTSGGTDWRDYDEEPEIAETVRLYFLALAALLLDKQPPGVEASAPMRTRKAAAKANKPNGPVRLSQYANTPKPVTPAPVEIIRPELQFIKRFLKLHNTDKERDQVLRFLNALQKAMLEKKIRKTSPYAAQILYIQDTLIKAVNTMPDSGTIVISDDMLKNLQASVGQEDIMPEVQLIKRYIGLHGKTGVHEKAKSLLAAIDKSIERGIITDKSPYYSNIHQIQKNLRRYLAAGSKNVLNIDDAELNGLQGVLDGCNCEMPATTSPIMSSMDFSGVHFETLGFTGKYRDLIGDPSPNFSMMISALPKYGKSTFACEFAGYLAHNHGCVLFVAKEEKFGKTLQDKFLRVKHPRLYIADDLPSTIDGYDFVVLDSVNSLGFSPADLRLLRENNQGKAFIFIFQSTKAGKFRGDNTFQHDVDSVVTLPEPGKVVQMGRYNQGGEMQLWESPLAA